MYPVSLSPTLVLVPVTTLLDGESCLVRKCNKGQLVLGPTSKETAGAGRELQASSATDRDCTSRDSCALMTSISSAVRLLPVGLATIFASRAKHDGWYCSCRGCTRTLTRATLRGVCEPLAGSGALMFTCRAGAGSSVSAAAAVWLSRKELRGSAKGEGRSMLGCGAISSPACGTSLAQFWQRHRMRQGYLTVGPRCTEQRLLEIQYTSRFYGLLLKGAYPRSIS